MFSNQGLSWLITNTNFIPMPHPLIPQLKDLLRKNNAEVLQHLQKVFTLNTPALNAVLSLSMELSQLRMNSIAKRLSNEEETRQQNDIHHRILSLIDTITDTEAAAYELENAIFKKILVVCKSAEREEYMRALFPEQYFKGVEYEVSEKPRLPASVNRFDLVIFDNTPHNDNNDLLLYYLGEDIKPYLLYFGKQLNLLWDYPEKAYFANSVFSLHARIEEMMTYLKYRRT